MTVFQGIFGNNARVKVIEFFLEHPVHEFTPKQVAKYLGLTYHCIRNNIKKINAEYFPFVIFTWCGEDRFDKWKLNTDDVVVKRFLTISTLDTLRKINK